MLGRQSLALNLTRKWTLQSFSSDLPLVFFVCKFYFAVFVRRRQGELMIQRTVDRVGVTTTHRTDLMELGDKVSPIPHVSPPSRLSRRVNLFPLSPLSLSPISPKMPGRKEGRKEALVNKSCVLESLFYYSEKKGFSCQLLLPESEEEPGEERSIFFSFLSLSSQRTL